MPRFALEVPALEWEERDWVAENDGMRSRREMSLASGRYRSALTPCIASLSFLVPSDLAADTEEAVARLTEFDSYARLVLGPGSPTLGPMSSILLRTESTSSSQIENLTVGARQLALAEIEQATSDNARLVVANVRSMEAALGLADRLDAEAVLSMHRELLSAQPGWEEQAGRWRQSLVWVGSSPVTPLGASHVAPQAEHVPAAINDLMKFVARDDLPVLTQAAIAHAQFETVHPFGDGNGRTGRALVHAILRAKRVVTSTTAPVSAGLLRQTTEYFDALDAYRQGDARPIVERFVSASLYAAHSGKQLVDNLAAQVEVSRERMSSVRRHSTAWEVLPLLVSHPVVNTALLGERLGVSNTAALRALDQLTSAGVLEERTGKQRNRVWQHRGILDVLDAYAQQLRRV